MDTDDVVLGPGVERKQWTPELEPWRGWRGTLWAGRPKSQSAEGVMEECQISDGVPPTFY